MHWLARALGELVGLFVLLRILTIVERSSLCRAPWTSGYCRVPWDGLRIHLLLALLVYWLAQWQAWTGCAIAILYVLALGALVLVSGSLFQAMSLDFMPLIALPILAFMLGVRRHRRSSE